MEIDTDILHVKYRFSWSNIYNVQLTNHKFVTFYLYYNIFTYILIIFIFFLNLIFYYFIGKFMENKFLFSYLKIN